MGLEAGYRIIEGQIRRRSTGRLHDPFGIAVVGADREPAQIIRGRDRPSRPKAPSAAKG